MLKYSFGLRLSLLPIRSAIGWAINENGLSRISMICLIVPSSGNGADISADFLQLIVVDVRLKSNPWTVEAHPTLFRAVIRVILRLSRHHAGSFNRALRANPSSLNQSYSVSLF